MIKVAIVVFLSLSLISCTTMQAVEASKTENPYQIESGDDIILSTLKGDTFALEIRSVSEDALVGADSRGKLWKVPYRQIASLQVEKVDAAKTVGISVLAWVVIVAVVSAVVGHALSNSLK